MITINNPWMTFIFIFLQKIKKCEGSKFGCKMSLPSLEKYFFVCFGCYPSNLRFIYSTEMKSKPMKKGIMLYYFWPACLYLVLLLKTFRLLYPVTISELWTKPFYSSYEGSFLLSFNARRRIFQFYLVVSLVHFLLKTKVYPK